MAKVYMIGSFKGGVGKSDKPIRISANIRKKYFRDTDPKEVEEIIDKALAAWFKKKR